ncbi:IPT/TIG domain-containing protein [Streptomyces cucumeris]|uniref:IPT/TIG domain-containing protein n=1 Tax=Streptomyces cucumeris TaxID=2962890 RepID=UPI003D719B1C
MAAPGTNVVVLTPTTLTVTTPAGAAGPANVTVTTPGGSGTLPAGYLYLAVPTITGVSPSSGPLLGGQTVTITGSGFAAGTTTVLFGLVPGLSVTVVSPTQLTVVTPPGVGTVDVTVTTLGGTATLPGAYTYAVSPTVLAVVPPAGPTTGGQTVTVTGTGFVAGNTQVDFG